MKTKSLIAFFSFRLLLPAITIINFAGAQNTSTPFQKLVDDVIREQLHLGNDQDIPSHFSNEFKAPFKEESSILSLGEESVVSSININESEVHAAINPTDTNNIIISPIRGTTPIFCPVYYTKDFGKTWAKSNFSNMPSSAGESILGGGDPVLAFDANGRAYFSWISLHFNGAGDSVFWHLKWAYSDNGGASWIRPANDKIAASKTSFTNGQVDWSNVILYDKQWMAVDFYSSAWKNNLYVAMMEADVANQTATIVVRTKPALSNVFIQTSVPISTPDFQSVQFAGIDVDRNGDVHVSFFGSKDGNDFALWHAVSKDGGASFQPLVKIADIHAPGFSGDEQNPNVPGMQRLDPGPHLAIDKTTGKNANDLYIVWSANGFLTKLKNGLDIYFSRSTDGGNSWSAPFVINHDSTGKTVHQYCPAITVNNNGTIALSWYDRRDDVSKQRNTHIYLATSTDGGLTFPNNLQVTQAPTDFATVGSKNSGFGIGEYTCMVSSPGYAIPVWADGRKNNGDLDIYSAFISIADSMAVQHIVPLGDAFSVSGPFPNPTTGGQAQFEVNIPQDTYLEISFVNLLGQQVATLVNDNYIAGSYSFHLPSEGLSRGVYFLSVRSGLGNAMKKVVLAK